MAAAALAAYANSFRVPLLLDDGLAISQNPSIRHLWPPTGVFRTPDYAGTSGRPLLNLTFALNYAFGGRRVWGYHAVNFALLLLSGLTLMGIVRRALQSNRFQGQFADSAEALAAVIAGIWLVHPLLTESVTYISERAESLMGLFYLLTVYCLQRGASGGPSNRRWLAASLVSCWLGVMTKEVMATAPVVAFIFDAIFIAGSASAAWRARRNYYLMLAASWLLLAALMIGLGRHSVGYHQGVGPFEYLLTECQALARYLQLSIWPSPLVFDYGPQLVSHPLAVAAEGLVILALLAGTAAALRRAPAAAFLGIWFFFILAPTSSFIPVALQPIAENRMYLPLAAIVAAVVLALHRWLRGLVVWIGAALGLILVLLTFERNAVYRSERSIWADTAAKRPHNPRALDNYGTALMSEGRLPEALRYYRAALQLTPRVGRMHYNLGKALAATGDKAGAIGEYEIAARLEPGFADAHVNLASALAEAGRPAEARTELGRALQLNSNDAASHYNLGLVLFNSAHFAEAEQQFRRALELDPDAAPTEDALATTLFRLRRPEEAIHEYEKLLRRQPQYAPAENNLGNVLLALGQPDAARAHFERAVQLNPEYAQAHVNFGLLEVRMGRVDAAQAQFETALRLNPTDARAQFELGNVMGMKNDMTAAMARWRESLRLMPNNAEAENNLGLALAQQGKTSEAIEHYEAALRIDPTYDRAKANLEEVERVAPNALDH